jgi:hypothetical protein
MLDIRAALTGKILAAKGAPERAKTPPNAATSINPAGYGAGFPLADGNSGEI